jgi:hypothetical protein
MHASILFGSEFACYIATGTQVSTYGALLLLQKLKFTGHDHNSAAGSSFLDYITDSRVVVNVQFQVEKKFRNVILSG